MLGPYPTTSQFLGDHRLPANRSALSGEAFSSVDVGETRDMATEATDKLEDGTGRGMGMGVRCWCFKALTRTNKATQEQTRHISLRESSGV